MGHTVQCDTNCKDKVLFTRVVSKILKINPNHFEWISNNDEAKGVSYKVKSSSDSLYRNPKNRKEDEVYLWQGQVGRTQDRTKVTQDPAIGRVKQIHVLDIKGLPGQYSDLVFVRKPNGKISLQVDEHNTSSGDSGAKYIDQNFQDVLNKEIKKEYAHETIETVLGTVNHDVVSDNRNSDGSREIIIEVEEEDGQQMPWLNLA